MNTRLQTISVDMHDRCTHCGRDTSMGSGLFVNRIPCTTDATLTLSDATTIDVDVHGYMCIECQSIPCDRCGDSVAEYTYCHGHIMCDECHEEFCGDTEH